MKHEVIVFPKVAQPDYRPHDSSFEYRFEEAGIETAGGNRVGYFDGSAEIYWVNNPDAFGGYEWWVDDIWLDTRHAAEKLDHTDPIYIKILSDLETAFKDAIDAAVEEQRS